MAALCGVSVMVGFTPIRSHSLSLAIGKELTLAGLYRYPRRPVIILLVAVALVRCIGLRCSSRSIAALYGGWPEARAGTINFPGRRQRRQFTWPLYSQLWLLKGLTEKSNIIWFSPGCAIGHCGYLGGTS